MRFFKALIIFFVIFFFPSYGYEDFVQYEKGYYFVEIKGASAKTVNAKLIEEINSHRWDIIHTINVDKTAGLKSFYKTHLLCRGDYLKKGLKIFKPIGIIISCKMSILLKGIALKFSLKMYQNYLKFTLSKI